MPELTITGRIARRTVGRRPPKPTGPAAPPAPTRPSGPSPLARMLALAYRIEQLIDAGLLEDHADAARRLGVTRARMSQVASLYLLPTEVQEEILLGRTRATERALRFHRALVDEAPPQS